MAWDVLGIKNYEFYHEVTNKKGEKVEKTNYKIKEKDEIWNQIKYSPIDTAHNGIIKAYNKKLKEFNSYTGDLDSKANHKMAEALRNIPLLKEELERVGFYHKIARECMDSLNDLLKIVELE